MHHATRAGTYGDFAFAAEVSVRPFILQSVLREGFAALWTDSDMVWLGNPLPLLPDLKSSSTVSKNSDDT